MTEMKSYITHFCPTPPSHPNMSSAVPKPPQSQDVSAVWGKQWVTSRMVGTWCWWRAEHGAQTEQSWAGHICSGGLGRLLCPEGIPGISVMSQLWGLNLQSTCSWHVFLKWGNFSGQKDLLFLDFDQYPDFRKMREKCFILWFSISTVSLSSAMENQQCYPVWLLTWSHSDDV